MNLALSNPRPAATNAIDFQPAAVLQINDNDSGSSGQFLVTNTNDSGTGSLRQAIINADAAPYPSTILFDIPAATDPLLSIPVSGFDPSTQTWTIALLSPLPAITQTVTIDGYSEGITGVPFRYPSQVISAMQGIVISATGGTFTLRTSAPLPGGQTPPIPFTAEAQTVQTYLEAIVGSGNVSVTGQPSTGTPFFITFQGSYAGQPIPNLIADGSNLTGFAPSISVLTVTPGGVTNPTYIHSMPNSTAALQGNNAEPRVIINGSQTGGGTGFVINASHCVLDGLIIDGFGIGVSVPYPMNVGDLIQGNFIGDYLLYPVDPSTGTPLTGLTR